MDIKKLERSIGILLTFLIFTGQSAWAQSTLYATSAGQTSFFSKTPVEDIKAVNKKTQVILNTTSGEIAVRMNMRDFDFPNELMEEHFNENYMESAKYPTSTFKGKVDQDIDLTKNGTYNLTASGTFTIHGKSQNRTLKGDITVKGGEILINSEFNVSLSDHSIDVPKIVFVKIAQNIQVKSSYSMVPYKQ
jgi:polyisoprenoid-binding protein YceI